MNHWNERRKTASILCIQVRKADYATIGVQQLWSLNIADIVSFVAFVIAIWQIRRAATISQSTREAVESASARASVYHTLLLAPQFEKCEAQLETAALAGKKNELLDQIRDWRRLSAELLGLIPGDGELNIQVIDKIQETNSLIAAAKKRILASESDALVKNTEKLRESASEAVGLVVTLAAQIKTNLGPIEGLSSQ